MVCAAAARRVPLGGADERAVRRAAIVAVRHGGRAPTHPRPRHPRRSGRAAATAQALPLVLLDAAGERRHVDAPQGVHDFLRAYYPPQERRLESATHPLPLQSWRAGELAKLPTYYSWTWTAMAQTVAPYADAREIAACRGCPTRSLLSTAREYAQDRFPGRAALVSLPHGRRDTRRTPALLRPHHRRAFLLHLRAEDWGIYQRPGVYERCRRAPAAA